MSVTSEVNPCTHMVISSSDVAVAKTADLNNSILSQAKNTRSLATNKM